MLEMICVCAAADEINRVAERDHHFAEFQAGSGLDFPYCLIAAWAAARRAMGTRNGEQDT